MFGDARSPFLPGDSIIPPMPGRRKSAERADPRPMPTNYIKQWRRFRGRMTLEGLAERTGYARSTIADIENLKSDFSGKSLLAIACALDTTPSALLDTDPSKGEPLELTAVWRELGLKNRLDEAAALLDALNKVR